MREGCLASLYRVLLEALHRKSEARLSPGLFVLSSVAGSVFDHAEGVVRGRMLGLHCAGGRTGGTDLYAIHHCDIPTHPNMLVPAVGKVRVHSGVLRLLFRGGGFYNIVRCGHTGFAFCAPGPCLGLVARAGASGSRLSLLDSKKARRLPGLPLSWLCCPGGCLLALHAWRE